MKIPYISRENLTSFELKVNPNIYEQLKEKITDKTKLLIFKPEEDRQLLGEYTDKFASMARVKVKKVQNARHEIFMSGNETLKWYVDEIIEFFRD